MASTLPRSLEFLPQQQEGVEKRLKVALEPAGYSLNFRWHDYSVSHHGGPCLYL